MTKILIAHFTPRGERSNTKKLVDYTVQKLSDNNEIDYLDLGAWKPVWFDNQTTPAYYNSYYGDAPLSEEMKPFQAEVDRVKVYDKIILAFPMYNFSKPAVVKAWVESILLNGQTWKMDETGFVGLMKGKVLILSTSGGNYKEGPMVSYNHATTLAQQEFGFMGYETSVVWAAGLNMGTPEQSEEIMQAAYQELNELLPQW